MISSKMPILALLLISLCFEGFSQTASSKDSLLTIIRKAKQDTVTALANIEYGRIISDEFVDSSTHYFKKGFSLSKKLNYKRGIASYYLNIIFTMGNRKLDTKGALALAREFEKFAEKENDDKIRGQASFAYAALYQRIDQYDSTIYYYEKTLRLFNKIHKTDVNATIYGNLTNVYRSHNMLDIALEYANKAHKEDIKNKDTLAIISDNVNRSLIYFDKKDFKNEEKCNREALRLSEIIKNPYRIMTSSINMAAMFDDKKMLDSSLYYNKKGLDIATKNNFNTEKVEFLMAIALAYSTKKQFQEANKYLTLAIDDPEIKKLPLHRQLFLVELKMKIYRGVGEYKKAIDLMEDYMAINDSTNVEETQEKILEFNNKLKKAESEKVILEKEVEINKQKTWLYLLSISGIALLLLGFLFYRYQNKKQEAKSQQIKLLEQENEFVAVKSSLEGQLNERVRISKEIHDDLGSSLTSISLLTEVLKTKVDGVKVPEVGKISATSARMVDSMNEIVWALNVHNDTLDSLVAFIRKYARDFLQDTPIKLVFEEDVNQDFTLQGNVRRSIYLVVKEAINNVVKHADAQQVKLNIHTDNNKLTIVIEDDGKGINEEKKSVFGNGLRNMKQRIEDIGGTFAMYQTKGMVVSIEYNF
jgi:signal transduction histidine kinase